MAGVAWAALAGWVLAAALLLLAHRRIEQLQRADTARKWDLLALRAELGALRGELRPGEAVREVAAADPVVGAGVPDPAGSAAPPGRRAGSTEAQSTEARSTEARSTEARSTEARSTEARSTEARSTEARSTEARSTEARSTEARSTEARSTEARSTEARTAEARTTGPTAWRRSHHRPARRDRRRTY